MTKENNYDNHTEIVNQMFNKCLIEENEFYFYVTSNEDNIFYISMMSMEMFEYDKEYLVIDKINNYRPYFLEMLVAQVDERERNFLNKWCNTGKWFLGHFQSDRKKQDTNKENLLIFGTVLRSASPFDLQRGVIIVKSSSVAGIDLTEKLNLSIYNTSSSVISTKDLKTILDKSFDNDIFTTLKIRMYNAEHGNLIYVYANNNRIIFDIGQNAYATDQASYLEEVQKNRIPKLNPTLFIISHWDLDHYAGVVYLPDTCFEDKIWIAQDINQFIRSSKLSALRVTKYLQLKGCLKLIDYSNKGKLLYKSTNENFKLWHGTGDNSMTHRTAALSEINNSGLIIEIRFKKKKCLLTGDCEYFSLPYGLKFSCQKYNYLYVPHHCSKMDTSLINSSKKKGFQAFVSAERNYCDTHKKYLKNIANYKIFDTIETCYVESDIISNKVVIDSKLH